MGKWLDRVKSAERTTEPAHETPPAPQPPVTPLAPAPAPKPATLASVHQFIDPWEPTRFLPERLLPEDRAYIEGCIGWAGGEVDAVKLIQRYCEIWKQAPRHQGGRTANAWLRTVARSEASTW